MTNTGHKSDKVVLNVFGSDASGSISVMFLIIYTVYTVFGSPNDRAALIVGIHMNNVNFSNSISSNL